MQEIRLPVYFSRIADDHDLQLFTGLLLCMGFGLQADTVGLSSALGSFIAGVLVGRLKVFFTALFFVSIGLRVDLTYFLDHTDTSHWNFFCFIQQQPDLSNRFSPFKL